MSTRWSYTSTPRYWPIPTSRASPSSRTGHTFPRERRGDSPGVHPTPVTPAATHAPRRTGAHRGDRGTDPNHSSRLTPGAPASGPGLPLSGMPGPGGPGSPPAPLGAGWPTTLSNLALLCRRHHRAVHEEGFQVERRTDGGLRFLRPDGREVPEVPPPAALPHDAVQSLRARHAAQGLHLHARTGISGWLGERLDLGWAIDVLHPRARHAEGGKGS